MKLENCIIHYVDIYIKCKYSYVQIFIYKYIS